MVSVNSKDDRVFICVLLDGLGYDLVNEISFLSDLLDDVKPVKTVLGYSCAAQPSILTGLMPQEHGGLCVYYRSDESVFEWTRMLPQLPEELRRRKWRDAVNTTRKLHGVTGHFNVWEVPPELLHRFQLYEQKNFYLDNPLEGIPTILDDARENGITTSAYYWNTLEEHIFGETEEKLATREAHFHYLYISGTDHLLHMEGSEVANVREKLESYAEKIRRIHEVATENYRDVQLLVFSDHGMVDVTGKVDVMNRISALPYKLGEDYLAFYDATMVRFWFDNKECRGPIMDVMASIDDIRLLSEDELEELGSLFPDRRYGEAIYLADGGKIISPSFFGTLDHVRGMHGYHPETPRYDAFVGCFNVDIGEPKAITDLYGIMQRTLLKSSAAIV